MMAQLSFGGAMARRAPLWCALLSSALSVPAQADNRLAIEIGEPTGFSSLTAERTMLVDLYFGGVRRGEAQITIAPGLVRFAQPNEVLALLPAFTKPEVVLGALSRHDLPANSDLKCGPGSDSRVCGRMSPELLGVIYDPDRFRLDIFINPELVAIQASIEKPYLPEPQQGLSLVNSVGAVLSGHFGRDERYFSVFDQLVLAKGERRLRADVGFAKGFGFEAERIAFEWDRPGIRYSGGALWSPGTEVYGRRKLLGAGVESQIDTRLDKDRIAGSPVVFYLDQRARVDVLRDGRLIGSAIYEAGNQQIDTSNLPDGSYDITLRIEEPGRPVREERRLFSKSRRIPSLGRTDFFAFGGVLLDRSSRGERPNKAYLNSGLAFRASRHWAMGGSMELAGRSVSGELWATLLTPFAQFRAAAVGAAGGAVGGILQVASAGTSRLNFNFDLRRVSQDHVDPATGIVSAPTLTELPFEFAADHRPRGDYAQIGGLVSYTFADLRFLGTGHFRQDEGQDAQYSVGPSLQWDVLRRGQLTMTLRGDVTLTERGSAGFAGLSLRVAAPRSSISALVGGRASSIKDDDQGQGSVAAISGSWSSDLGAGDLAIGAGLEHQPRRNNVLLTGDFRHPAGSLTADIVHTDKRGTDSTNYSLGFQTTLAADGGDLYVAGKTASESLLVAQVRGASAGDTFEVVVNDQTAGLLKGGTALTLALPSYRNYHVRIRATGERLLAYDNTVRSVALYPGSVARLDWSAAPITLKVGRLVTSDGEPVRGAILTANGVWSETDYDGWFQIEAPDRAELAVSLPDGRTLAVTLPTGLLDADAYRVGSVVCCTRDTQLGVASPAHMDLGVK